MYIWGGRVTWDGRSKREMYSRIQQARLALNKKSKLFESNNIDIHLRKQLAKTYVWSVLLYGCETWCITERDYKRLEAFEMWTYRRILGISWRDHITNEEVLAKIGERKHLKLTIMERRARWIGHVLRHENLLHTVIEGMVEGNNFRGRPRQQYLDQVIKDMNCSSYVDLKRTAEDREEWKKRCQMLLQTNHYD